MSLAHIEKEIADFLTSNDAKVLCVRGKWGVGKTYQLRQKILAFKPTANSAFKKFAYVSLFGLKNLDELKSAIFENTLTLNGKRFFASVDSFEELASDASVRSIYRLTKNLPIVQKFIGSAAAQFSFFAVRDQIICFDDLERKNKSLEAGEVLGLSSYLKEQRNCKVILVVNDEKLSDREEFEKYLEKVVDISVVYAPTSQESIEIALPNGDKISQHLRNDCRTLSISNIRVIRKAEFFCRKIERLLSAFDEKIYENAISSIVLFTWATLQPDEAPSREFILGRTETSYLSKAVRALNGDKATEESLKEGAWSALLDAYGYVTTDELDQELFKGIERGYFDPELIDKHAKKRQEILDFQKGKESIGAAWKKYRESFADNEAEVVEEILKATKQNIEYVSPYELNSAVEFLKDLGRKADAQELISFYISKRTDEREFFNLSSDDYGRPYDDDVKAAFETKLKALPEKCDDIADLLVKLRGGWNDELLKILSAASVESFKEIFKKEKGDRLRTIIAGALQFNKVINATAQQKEISAKALQALTSIGEESNVNARRVSAYGVVVVKK